MITFEAAIKLGTFRYDATFGGDTGVLALFGRSGSGKSVTIALIAGLLRPDAGRIAVDDRVLVDTEKRIFVPKHSRRIGLVYQDAQLFPHMTVRHNLMFGRWFAARDASPDPGITFDSVVGTLGIGHLLERRPGHLSGGERQRIAIGRALLSSPRLLLMDEPLASLDEERKHEVLPLIERLRDEFKIPIVYVSHAVDEVARLASRVVVLNDGHVTRIGSAEEVFGAADVQAGQTRFGVSSVLAGKVAAHATGYGLTEIEHPAGTIWLAGPAGPAGRTVRIVIRATDVSLATARPQGLSVRTILGGKVAVIRSESGPLATITIDLDGQGVLAALATRMAVDEMALQPGLRVYALIKTVALDERSLGI